MDPIPYNEHSFLAIDRKERSSSRTFSLFIFFFRLEEFLISKAAPHKHPTHMTMPPFESTVQIGLHSYFHSKDEYQSIGRLLSVANIFIFTGLRAPLVLLEGKLFYSDFFLRVGRRILPIPERSLGRLWKLKRKLQKAGRKSESLLETAYTLTLGSEDAKRHFFQKEGVFSD